MSATIACHVTAIMLTIDEEDESPPLCTVVGARDIAFAFEVILFILKVNLVEFAANARGVDLANNV